MNLPISVIILTHNEEINLDRALKNVSDFADEVFVVDSYSTDRTLEIAEKYGAKTVQHKFENQAQQFNWALDNLEIKNEWILRLDADEYLSEELKKEISGKLSGISENISGFYIKRRNYFMGRWIKHGGYYPTWILRLFRKGKAKSEEREMDEHIVLLEGKSGYLQHDFIDDNHSGLSAWIQKHNNYATREANLQFEKKKSEIKGKLGGSSVEQKRWLKENVYYKFPLFIRSFLFFVYRYFIRLGFLDGTEGLIFHFLQAFWYRFLVDAKLYERLKTKKQ